MSCTKAVESPLFDRKMLASCFFSSCLILAERCDQVADYEEGVKSRTQELEVGFLTKFEARR